MLEERTSAVARLQGERDTLRAERDCFRTERDALRTERDTASAEVEKLQLIIKELMRNRYGARSEKLDPDQLQLALEEVAQSLGLTQTVVETQPAADKQATGERQPPQRNRGALPPHLPRVEIVVDVEDKRCPCCGGAMHVIGEDVAEMLDVVPAVYQVKVIRRPRGACPRESGGLPRLRGCGGAGAGTGAATDRRHGDRGSAGPGTGRQVQRPSCVPNPPTAMEVRSCVRDEAGPLAATDQEVAANHRELLS